MQIPTTVYLNNLDATLLAPQTREVTRFKATMPVYGAENRMLAPLYAELIKRGTKSKTRKEFAEALEILGAQLDVVSDQFGVTITGVALSQTFPAFLRLVAEMLRTPVFSQKEITQVQTHYQQALHDEQDDARTRAYDAFTQTLYPQNHPYYRPTVAARRTHMKSVTRKTYLDFHKKLFGGKTHMSVSISAADAMRKKIMGMFSSFVKSGKIVPASVPQALAPKETTIYQSVPSKANVELYIGNTLPLSFSDPDFLPFQFGLAVLGKWGGFSGRLMSTVREKEGLSYTIYARTEGVTKTQSGMWYIFTFFTPKDLDKGLSSIKREIRKITERGVSEKEMVRFKELLKNQFILAHESDAKALAMYHDALCAGMTPAEIAAQYDTIQKLTRKEVNAALAQYLDPDTLVISGAGPITPQEKLSKISYE